MERTALVLAALVLIAPAAGSAADRGFSVSTGFEHTGGDYGAQSDTDILYIPTTAS